MTAELRPELHRAAAETSHPALRVLVLVLELDGAPFSTPSEWGATSQCMFGYTSLLYIRTTLECCCGSVVQNHRDSVLGKHLSNQFLRIDFESLCDLSDIFLALGLQNGL
jgi:hypothetical protein